jgi:hypothetical protein
MALEMITVGLTVSAGVDAVTGAAANTSVELGFVKPPTINELGNELGPGSARAKTGLKMKRTMAAGIFTNCSFAEVSKKRKAAGSQLQQPSVTLT